MSRREREGGKRARGRVCRSAGENGGRRRETAGGMGIDRGSGVEGVKGLQGCVGREPGY